MRTKRNHHVIVYHLAAAIERVARLLSLSHSPFAFFLHYLSLFSFSFHPKSDISAL